MYLLNCFYLTSFIVYSMSGAVCGVAYEEGDLHCDDYLNREECNYDHGDCCLPEIIDTSCTQCLCLEDGTRHPTNEALSQGTRFTYT